MGAEYLVIALAFLGAGALLLLLYLTYKPAVRPYALPTLLFSCAAGGWFALGKSVANLHWNFAIGFLLGAVLFGLHAAVIKKLLRRSV